MSSDGDDIPSTYTPLVSAVLGGLAGGLILGLDQNVEVPLVGPLRAPLGLGIHVGLASWVGQMAAPTLDGMSDTLKKYQGASSALVTGAVTPALLGLAGEGELGMGTGALVGAVSDYVATMY